MPKIIFQPLMIANPAGRLTERRLAEGRLTERRLAEGRLTERRLAEGCLTDEENRPVRLKLPYTP